MLLAALISILNFILRQCFSFLVSLVQFVSEKICATMYLGISPSGGHVKAEKKMCIENLLVSVLASCSFWRAESEIKCYIN